VALTSFEAITPLPLAAQYLGSNLAAASRLFQIVDVKPPCATWIILLPCKEYALEFKNLRFGYPSAGQVITLDGLSFSLPPGVSWLSSAERGR